MNILNEIKTQILKELSRIHRDELIRMSNDLEKEELK